MEEKGHVLHVLEQVKKAVREEDTVKLKELSNQTIHSASINQDIESIMVAVIIYSLGKIIERTDYREYPGWNKFFSSFMKHIDQAIFALSQDREETFRKKLKNIRKEISKLSGKFKEHVQDVFKKAEINKASRIYEHGISQEKTAKLLGISAWELAEYTGQTGISNVNLNITLPIKTRIKIALDIFK